jgi:hypothetical protein
MNFINEAERILGVSTTEHHQEPPVDWVQEPVPHDAAPGEWRFAKHPPAVPKDQRRDLVLCECGSVGIRLSEPHNDPTHGPCNYWCVHCGPQPTMSRYD